MSRDLEIQAKRKRRFIDLCKDIFKTDGMNINELIKVLECPDTTVKQTFNDKDVCTYEKTGNVKTIHLNAEVVIAFCHYYNIDINYIYFDENCEFKKIHKNHCSLFQHSADCVELQDEAFMGDFYGYTYNTMNNEIDNFTLHIRKVSDNTCNAELNLECFQRITDKKSKKIKKTLYGKPMHLKPDLIYIVFQANEGDEIYIFAFRYFKINRGKRLYCRYGSIITNRRETARYPQMQSFVFFDSPIKHENMHYIEGFLKLSSDKIIVPAKIFENNNMGTEEQKESIETFFEYCNDNDIHFHKEEYYCFSEKVLLALGESKEIPKDIMASTLITLKEKSINPSKISYPDVNPYSRFLASLSETDEIIFNEDEE